MFSEDFRCLKRQAIHRRCSPDVSQKSGELLGELSRCRVSWEEAPYCNVADVFRAWAANRLVKIHVTVERFAVPALITVTFGCRFKPAREGSYESRCLDCSSTIN